MSDSIRTASPRAIELTKKFSRAANGEKATDTVHAAALMIAYTLGAFVKDPANIDKLLAKLSEFIRLIALDAKEWDKENVH
jgi:hypothetical protein